MPTYRPLDYIGHETRKRSLVFLGGPIQGAEDWQAKAIAWFEQHAPTLLIASPRSSMWSKDLSKEERDRLYAEQYEWEHVHLEYAMRKGIVMFWLAPEVEHIPTRAFAQTTRIELAVILGFLTASMNRKLFFPTRAMQRPKDCLVVGAHADFSGRRYLAALLAKQGRPMHATLEETCLEALVVLKDRSKI